MKRVLIICLLLLTSFSLFAENGYVISGVTDNSFKRTELLDNPAYLADEQLKVVFPSIDVSANHIATLLSDYSDIIFHYKDMTYQYLADRGLEFLRTFPGGYSDVVSFNFYTGAQIKNLAFALSAQADLKSYADNYYAQVTNIGLYPSINGALSVGYGRQYQFGRMIFKGGISGNLAFKVVTEKIGASSLASVASDEVSLKGFLNNVKADAGYALTTDLALSFRMKYDFMFGFDINIHNFPGVYSMRHYDSISDLKSKHSTGTSYTLSTTSNSAVYMYSDLFPTSWNRYVSGYVHLGEKLNSKPNGGVEGQLYGKLSFNVLRTLNCSYTYEGGNQSVSASTDVFGNMLGITYGWHKENYGFDTRMVDTLTVSCKLGFKK